jgi:hypothetical protein
MVLESNCSLKWQATCLLLKGQQLLLLPIAPLKLNLGEPKSLSTPVKSFFFPRNLKDFHRKFWYCFLQVFHQISSVWSLLASSLKMDVLCPTTTFRRVSITKTIQFTAQRLTKQNHHLYDLPFHRKVRMLHFNRPRQNMCSHKIGHLVNIFKLLLDTALESWDNKLCRKWFENLSINKEVVAVLIQ